MRSIVCVEPGKLESQIKDKPVAASGEVLVKIKSIGICGTDIHAFGGNQPFFSYPRVLGHELSGEIEAVGEGVDLPIGQAVYVIPYISCGKCVACRKGKTNCCSNIEVIGVHRDGGMCEYLAVPASAVVKADGLSFNDMAVVECLAIGAHAVRRAQISQQDTVLVLGAGPIGIGALQFAQEAGAKVLVADVKQEKLDFCRKEYQVDGVVDVTADVEAQLRDLTQGDFPSVIIDCTGNLKAMQSAFTQLAHGGTIVFVSVVKGDVSFTDTEFHKRETTLLGSRNATLEDFEHVVACLKAGTVKSSALITHTTKFSGLVESFTQWVKPESGVIKAVVEMD
ncbi:alcohol dehydrogenase GroES domain-containing protein [Catenovulum agarivorans DS-2]|uniref:Alcohol dehydrogenase GroES domain-containing protein n=1 Tax=Catenovulum agarivorans DS-2 TaxID=1328313 RepID=W7Q829_9ALTE|nr:zinc-binding alcohol dehydrogenase family protein [Catenovulum agarivorans]EWH08964.1 alcohol dehydrogenase GroES domain-containing protein [Catenovulum agarivorans DS-2]